MAFIVITNHAILVVSASPVKHNIGIIFLRADNQLSAYGKSTVSSLRFKKLMVT